MCITSSSLPICSQFLHFPQECATISLSPIPKKTLQQFSNFLSPFLPFASCTTSFSKDHFFVRKGSFSSSKLLPSSPSNSLSLSLLPSAQNPKCTTTGLSNILLILLNPLLFCLALMIILSTRAFSSTNLCLLFLLLQFWSSFALQCARACHSTRSEQGGK